MKILLIQARFNVHFGYITPPLGLISLSAFLKQAGYRDVEVMHPEIMDGWRERLEERLREFKPDVVGISAMTAQAGSMREIAAMVKRAAPETLVLAGGPYPTHYPENCAADPSIDAAVLHEGELTLLELVRHCEEKKPFDGIKGIAFRRGTAARNSATGATGAEGSAVGLLPQVPETMSTADGAVVRNPPREFIEDLDSLPLPDWGALDLDAYQNFMPCSILAYKKRYMSVMNSRGCPYRCTFCHKVMGKKFRAQSPERIVLELSALSSRHGINHIEVLDDIANYDTDRFKAALRAIAAGDLNLTIYLASGLRGDLLDEETIDLMPAAGVVDLTVAVESGSPRVQELMRKNLDLDRIKRMIAYAARKGLYVQGLFMIGFPGETMNDMWKTLRFAAGSKLHSMMIATCFGFRGTELGDTLPQGVPGIAAMNPENDVSVYEGYSFTTCSQLPPWKIKLMKFLINLTFYYNPFRLWRLLRALPDLNAALAGVLLKKMVKKTIILR